MALRSAVNRDSGAPVDRKNKNRRLAASCTTRSIAFQMSVVALRKFSLATGLALANKLRQLGIVLGQDFDIYKVNPAVAQGARQRAQSLPDSDHGLGKGGCRSRRLEIREWLATTTNTGAFRADYNQRALITMIGLYANLAQDSIYPISNGPGAGLEYSGANKYDLQELFVETQQTRGSTSKP